MSPAGVSPIGILLALGFVVFVNIGVWSGWVWGETKRETPWLYLGAKF